MTTSSQCLELIGEKEKLNQDAEKKEEKDIAEEYRRSEKELEIKRLDLELLKARNGREGSEASSTVERKSFRMKDLIQPYRSAEDIGLILVNIKRTCEKLGVTKATWPQRLLTLLPCEAADVIARLNMEEADDYDQVNASLLKRYRMSAEAFRQKFRNAEKQKDESYPEFAYKLMANTGEWLKETKAFDEKEKVMQYFGLEQSYRGLPQGVRLRVHDRPDVTTVSKAAELAEEFVSRHTLDTRQFFQRECHNKKAAWGKGQPSQEKNRARYAESSEKIGGRLSFAFKSGTRQHSKI